MRHFAVPACALALAHFALAQNIDPRDRAFWNDKFANSPAAFHHSPSRLLVDATGGRTPCAALDLGMGQGRNSIYLAQRGRTVTGVDLADVAVAQAKKRALQIGCVSQLWWTRSTTLTSATTVGISSPFSTCTPGITALGLRARAGFSPA